MAASDSAYPGVLVTFTIQVNRAAIPDTIAVLSVHIEKRVNRISTAKITVLDGEPNTGTFDISSSDVFITGVELSISAGYDGKEELVFKGIITRQSIRIDNLVGSALEVECRDAAVKMIVGRKSATYTNKTDAAIISSIISNYGLSAAVTATTTVWPQMVQNYVTDWDYILTRAEVNGMIITTLNGNIAVFKPDANTTPALTISYGDGMMEFRADMNAITQLNEVKASAWDYKTQAITTAEAENTYAGAGNLSAQKLSEVVGLSDYQLQTTAPVENADLTNWAQAQLVKSNYSKIQGEVKFQGSALVDPGKYIKLAGVGNRFNGDHLISGVTHDLSEGNWVTECAIGLSPLWFIEEPDVMSPPASGLLPAARGLYNGVVKQTSQDPEGQYRVLVDVPMFDVNGAGIWARLSNFYATNGAGAFFLPEVGDEAVLGFLNEDPRYPIIIGSMYSGEKAPFTGFTPDESNSIKGIVSRTGIAIKFDDQNKELTIVTPGDNTIVLSDKAKQITLQDSNQNSIIMSQQGITIKSAKDITLEAGQNINIKGQTGINVTASAGDVNVHGLNITATADMNYKAEGSMSAQVSAGMELTLKGAMIMIN